MIPFLFSYITPRNKTNLMNIADNVAHRMSLCLKIIILLLKYFLLTAASSFRFPLLLAKKIFN